MNINILGINITNLKKEKILEKIEDFLNSDKQYQITTPNPEIILHALKDEEFFYILSKADISIPDGVGLKFSSWTLGKNLHRTTGADLTRDILKLAEKQGKKVAILNWSGGLSSDEDIRNTLSKKFPKLEFIIDNTSRDWQNFNLEKIKEFKPDILFVNFGASWQEKFIYHNFKKLPSVKIGIGVGGSFDFLTGKQKRAPRVFRFIGLEWLWRLIKQRWRFKRIYNAVFIFPYKFFKWRFVKPFLYRPNVVCMVYKKEEDDYKILLVQRKTDKEDWQMPQGGTDGEDIITAGDREIKEELNTDKFKILAGFKNLHKYKFGNKLSKFGINSAMATGYKGQKQSLVIAKYLGNDEDIKINYWEHHDWKWVDIDMLIENVRPYRKAMSAIAIKKFNKIKNV